MFTGIIQDKGIVASLKKGKSSLKLFIQSSLYDQAVRGDSLAVEGVCLTVNAKHGGLFELDVMPETVERTTLRNIVSGKQVNLELALTPQSRMGGHWVYGHVDGVATLEKIQKEEGFHIYSFSMSPELMQYLIPKASLAICGVSLTCIDVLPASFTVGIIPTTQHDTTLQQLKVGEQANIEIDMLAKYLYHYTHPENVAGTKKPVLDKEFFYNHGF